MKRLFLNFLFISLSHPLFANWTASEDAPGTKGRDGSVRLVYSSESAAQPLPEVLSTLKDSGKILLIDRCSPHIIKNRDLNRQLVAALSLTSESDPNQLSDKILWSSFHHPDVLQFRKHLTEAVLSLPPFSELQNELRPHGLKVQSASCEKFSFRKDEDQRLVSGMGIHLRIEPIDFGLPSPPKEFPGWLHLSRLTKEEGQWIGDFSLSTKEGLQKIYGRWSEKGDCYLITRRDLAWTHGKEWQTQLAGPLDAGSPSFRIKEGLSYTIRIPLGTQSCPRAKVRIYSPAGILNSEEFILSEASYSFREKE